MRIAELTACHAQVPFKREVKHASHTRTANDTLLVRCRLDNGTIGWGEGLPREYVTGETFEQAWQLFHDIDWQSQLAPAVESFADAVRLARQIQMPITNGRRDCFGNSLRCAIELAVLDAFGKACGEPLASAVQISEPELFEPKPIARYSVVLPRVSKPRKERALALGARLFGFRSAKIKVACDGQDDVATVARVRRFAGRKMQLRIDANEAWTADELSAKLAPLERFHVDSCEQPVPHDRVNELARIRPSLAIPLMLDESLCSLTDADRAANEGLCDLLNIRLSKCGGLLPSLAIARHATLAGLGYQLGCQVGETGILSAAGRHFATAVKDIKWLEGSFDRWLVAERLTKEDLTFGWGGKAAALTGTGLGITVDETAVKRVTIRESRIAFT